MKSPLILHFGWLLRQWSPQKKNPPAEKAERGDIIGCSFSHRPQGGILRRGDVPFTTNDLIKGDLEVLPKWCIVTSKQYVSYNVYIYIVNIYIYTYIYIYIFISLSLFIDFPVVQHEILSRSVQQDAHPRILQPEPTPRILRGYQVLGLKPMMTWGSPTSAVWEIIQTNGMVPCSCSKPELQAPWQLSCRCPASGEAEPSSGLMNGAYEWAPRVCWKTLHPSTSYPRSSTSPGPQFLSFFASKTPKLGWKRSETPCTRPLVPQGSQGKTETRKNGTFPLNKWVYLI